MRQLSTHLREVQQGSSSSAQVAAMEAQQLQATVDSVRMELAMAKDAAETNEAVRSWMGVHTPCALHLVCSSALLRQGSNKYVVVSG